MDTLSTESGACLPTIARAAIASALGQSMQFVDASFPWPREPAASFVTLTLGGQLRGCIGTLQPHRSLLEDVRANAVAAALHDPRFAPLAAHELDALRIEVSVLAPPESVRASSEADLVALLRPGIDGVIVQYGAHRSTFLPQVWTQLPHPSDFLAHLKQKAGLPANFWHEAMHWQRYTVQKWSEPPKP